MEALYAVSVHSFFNNEDSSPTYRCYRPLMVMRICILILYMKLQLSHAALTFDSSARGRFKLTGYDRPPESDGHGHFQTKLQDKLNTALFFLEKDLKLGHKMKFLFTQSSNKASFLPRQVVKSIPFSSTKMAEILNKFSVKPSSTKAEIMKNTIKECEESAIKGEEKYCATSLESMLDFITSKLGKNVETLSTKVLMKKETKKQEYTITHGVEKVGETKVVVCHKLNYVYAVFYCHKIDNTVAYTVSLEGADGSRVKAECMSQRHISVGPKTFGLPNAKGETRKCSHMPLPFPRLHYVASQIKLSMNSSDIYA